MEEGEIKKICINCSRYKPNAMDDSYGRCMLEERRILVVKYEDHCANWSLNPDAPVYYDENKERMREAVFEVRAKVEHQKRARKAIFPGLLK